MFASLTDIISATTLLSITPSVRDALLAFKRGDSRGALLFYAFFYTFRMLEKLWENFLDVIAYCLFLSLQSKRLDPVLCSTRKWLID